jgi:hypothetical protein
MRRLIIVAVDRNSVALWRCGWTCLSSAGSHTKEAYSLKKRTQLAAAAPSLSHIDRGAGATVHVPKSHRNMYTTPASRGQAQGQAPPCGPGRPGHRMANNWLIYVYYFLDKMVKEMHTRTSATPARWGRQALPARTAPVPDSEGARESRGGPPFANSSHRKVTDAHRSGGGLSRRPFGGVLAHTLS